MTPLCKGGWQKSVISDWGIVCRKASPPSKIKDFAHLPLHRGGFSSVQKRTDWLSQSVFFYFFLTKTKNLLPK